MKKHRKLCKLILVLVKTIASVTVGNGGRGAQAAAVLATKHVPLAGSNSNNSFNNNNVAHSDNMAKVFFACVCCLHV